MFGIIKTSKKDSQGMFWRMNVIVLVLKNFNVKFKKKCGQGAFFSQGYGKIWEFQDFMAMITILHVGFKMMN